MLAFRPLFDARVAVAEIRSLGRTPLGERRVIPIVGGSLRGERLSGRVRPGGADWQTIGDDGAVRLDARYTLEARGAAGEPVDPAHDYFRTVLRFETGSPDRDWLNRVIAVTRGAGRPRLVELTAFELL